MGPPKTNSFSEQYWYWKNVRIRTYAYSMWYRKRVNLPIFLSLPTLPFTINRLLPLPNSNNIFPYLFLIISILLLNISKYICFVGDFNARTSNCDDFIILDDNDHNNNNNISDYVDNYTEVLESLSLTISYILSVFHYELKTWKINNIQVVSFCLDKT
jgi:VanZ family protein